MRNDAIQLNQPTRVDNLDKNGGQTSYGQLDRNIATTEEKFKGLSLLEHDAAARRATQEALSALVTEKRQRDIDLENKLGDIVKGNAETPELVTVKLMQEIFQNKDQSMAFIKKALDIVLHNALLRVTLSAAKKLDAKWYTANTKEVEVLKNAAKVFTERFMREEEFMGESSPYVQIANLFNFAEAGVFADTDIRRGMEEHMKHITTGRRYFKSKQDRVVNLARMLYGGDDEYKAKLADLGVNEGL